MEDRDPVEEVEVERLIDGAWVSCVYEVSQSDKPRLLPEALIDSFFFPPDIGENTPENIATQRNFESLREFLIADAQKHFRLLES